ncbi:MAG: hypothetical protein JSS20_06480 [Proteobacteria bacterium]|nr:hypothetical protein [Pseudomonadota bacterium]
MATAPKRFDSGLPKGLGVDAFLAWAMGRPGRFELHDGDVVAVAPERVWHAKTKFAVQRALSDAVSRASVPCYVLPDGVAVHVNDQQDGSLLTRLIATGSLRFDPPGIEIDIGGLFA